jgi:hypothetical protein
MPQLSNRSKLGAIPAFPFWRVGGASLRRKIMRVISLGKLASLFDRRMSGGLLLCLIMTLYSIGE